MFDERIKPKIPLDNGLSKRSVRFFKAALLLASSAYIAHEHSTV